MWLGFFIWGERKWLSLKDCVSLLSLWLWVNNEFLLVTPSFGEASAEELWYPSKAACEPLPQGLILGKEQRVNHALQRLGAPRVNVQTFPERPRQSQMWINLSSFAAFIQTIIKDSYGQPLWPTYYILDPVDLDSLLGIFSLFKHSQILCMFFYNSFVNIILLIYFGLCWVFVSVTFL